RRVRIAIRIERLLATLAELADGDLREDAQALPGVVVEQPSRFRAVAPRGRRLHRQDADGVDLVVAVQAGVGALAGPVAFLPGAIRHLPLARPGGGDLALADDAVGETLALVQAARADQAERRALGQRLVQLAVVL